MNDERIRDLRIRVEETPPRLVVTLDDAASGNSLRAPMVAVLRDAVRRANADTRIRVLVLTGAGKTFCSGSELASGLEIDGFAELLLAMAASEVPIVARVNGDAFGSGLGLVAASTFAIAVEHAMLGAPEIDGARFPMLILPLLARLVTRRRLYRLLCLNEPMTAAEAAEVGVVDRDVAPVHLDEFLDALVLKIAAKNGTALRHGLRALHAEDAMALSMALPLLTEALAALRAAGPLDASGRPSAPVPGVPPGAGASADEAAAVAVKVAP